MPKIIDWPFDDQSENNDLYGDIEAAEEGLRAAEDALLQFKQSLDYLKEEYGLIMGRQITAAACARMQAGLIEIIREDM